VRETQSAGNEVSIRRQFPFNLAV